MLLTDFFIKKNIEQLLFSDQLIDTVILGCTHYPIILNQIKSFLPENIQVVSQGDLVAASLANYLQRHPEIDSKCSKNHSIRYLTTESVEKFATSASIFLNERINAEHIDLG